MEPENIRKELFFNSRDYKEEIRGMIVLWKLASFFVRDKNDPGRSHGGLWGHREKALT